VAIPTYRREKELTQVISSLLKQNSDGNEILIVDQTPEHGVETKEKLQSWSAMGLIRWLRLDSPSITRAMNVALKEAESPYVLFLDDDIIPGECLLTSHLNSYSKEGVWAVAGQVLQPGEKPCEEPPQFRKNGFAAYLDFPFYSSKTEWIENGMAGNLSVQKNRAVEIGGFDENFVGVAYRFETDFCRRLCEAGGKIIFEPKASVRHLRASKGGTRSRGSHLCSFSPRHGVGDYYFALRQGMNRESMLYVLRRPFREVRTRYHLAKPWCIPVKLIGEMRAMVKAVFLAIRGPKYIRSAEVKTSAVIANVK
jgi:GT2 family glycosyltransferase